MNFNTKVAIATYVTFIGLMIVSVVLIVILTRSTVTSTSVTILPSPFVTPSTPSNLEFVRLKDANGLCYAFNNLGPQLGAPSVCNANYWIINRTPNKESITYDGQTFETCIEAPNTSGTFVLGTVGNGCVPVELTSENTIKSVASNLCIVSIGDTLTWGSCDTTPYVFTVDAI